MFDTMTLVKAVGAGCGGFLAFVVVSWSAQGLYQTTVGHGVVKVEQAYVVDTGGGSSKEAAAPVPFAELLAAADAGAGQKVFAKCGACHKVDGSNSTGPHLNGVVNRPVATAEGFAYSDGMKAHATEIQVWTPERIAAFIANPRGVVAGTKMTFAGLSKDQDRANVIAYLQTLR